MIRLTNSWNFSDHSILSIHERLLPGIIIYEWNSLFQICICFILLILSLNFLSVLCRFLGACVIMIYFSVIYGAYIPDWEFTVHDIDSPDYGRVFKVCILFHQSQKQSRGSLLYGLTNLDVSIETIQKFVHVVGASRSKSRLHLLFLFFYCHILEIVQQILKECNNNCKNPCFRIQKLLNLNHISFVACNMHHFSFELFKLYAFLFVGSMWYQGKFGSSLQCCGLCWQTDPRYQPYVPTTSLEKI